MDRLSNKNATCLLVVFLSLMFIPWLGETLFNSKGEPREAIVAVSMLSSGDWVLPVSYGADIPYKPPLLAWLIAICSVIFNGGEVNEFTSRLPSAIAAVAMIVGCFVWLRRYSGQHIALIACAVLASSFEVVRAAVACRVDMVLTACMVGALIVMHSWRESGGWGKLVLAAMLLSGAVLTKGPVGALLPCLAMGIYCLVRRDNFFRTLGILSAVCIASMVLPAIWYVAAYSRGGEAFISLAWEENIGRLIGHMGYDSHVNPWYYNVITLLAGMLPWTIVAIGTVFSLRKMIDALRPRTPVGIFCLVVSATVFIFYCIPASKRSVYLLPMYPMLSYGVAVLLIRFRRVPAMRIYSRVWLWLAILLPVVAIGLQWVHLHHLPLEPMPWWRYPLALLPTAVAVACLIKNTSPIKSLLISALILFFAYLAAFQPMVLNPKSDKPYAETLDSLMHADVPVYSLTEDSLMRYYTLNFYLGDRLRHLDAHAPLPASSCAVLVETSCADSLQTLLGEPSDTTLLIPKSCDNRRPVTLYIYK